MDIKIIKSYALQIVNNWCCEYNRRRYMSNYEEERGREEWEVYLTF
jgi:hypothetical protein